MTRQVFNRAYDLAENRETERTQIEGMVANLSKNTVF